MPRYFPYTEDGDQISIEFEYKEELDAFRVAIIELTRMRDALRRMEETEEFTVTTTEFPYKMKVARLQPNVKLLTTLQIETLDRYKMVATKLLGVDICNVFGRGEIHMSIFTGEVKS